MIDILWNHIFEFSSVKVLNSCVYTLSASVLYKCTILFSFYKSHAVWEHGTLHWLTLFKPFDEQISEIALTNLTNQQNQAMETSSNHEVLLRSLNFFSFVFSILVYKLFLLQFYISVLCCFHFTNPILLELRTFHWLILFKPNVTSRSAK